MEANFTYSKMLPGVAEIKAPFLCLLLPFVQAPTVAHMLLPSEQMGVTSHVGKQVPQLAHAIPPTPFYMPHYHRRYLYATVPPLVVGDSPGGFRISWPYYQQIGCLFVWLYHTDRRLNLNQTSAAAMSGLFRLLWID